MHNMWICLFSPPPPCLSPIYQESSIRFPYYAPSNPVLALAPPVTLSSVLSLCPSFHIPSSLLMVLILVTWSTYTHTHRCKCKPHTWEKTHSFCFSAVLISLNIMVSWSIYFPENDTLFSLVPFIYVTFFCLIIYWWTFRLDLFRSYYEEYKNKCVCATVG